MPKEYIESLLKRGADVSISKNGVTPLELVNKWYAYSKTIQMLLEESLKRDVAIPDSINGITPLEWAIQNKISKEAIIKLIDRIPDVNKRLSDGTTPFLCALEAGLPKEYIEGLLKRGADVAIPRSRADENKTPALVVAAMVPHNTEVMELLLQHGAAVDQTDGEGDSVISCLAGSDVNEENIEFLAKRTTNINHPGNYGVQQLIWPVRMDI